MAPKPAEEASPLHSRNLPHSYSGPRDPRRSSQGHRWQAQNPQVGHCQSLQSHQMPQAELLTAPSAGHIENYHMEKCTDAAVTSTVCTDGEILISGHLKWMHRKCMSTNNLIALHSVSLYSLDWKLIVSYECRPTINEIMHHLCSFISVRPLRKRIQRNLVAMFVVCRVPRLRQLFQCLLGL